MEKNKNTIRKIICWSVAALVVVLLIVIYAMTATELKKKFGRVDKKLTDSSGNYFYKQYEDEYPRSPISFKSGKNTLNGWVYGEENDKGLIVFAHGIGEGHETYIGIILGMVQRGWRVLSYDATGTCASEGKGTTGLAQSALDLNQALSYAENDPALSKLPLFVMGHSWGGYASVAVLNFNHNVKGAVSFSGYYKPAAELAEATEYMMGTPGKLLKPFVYLANFFTFGKYAGLSAVKGINKSGIPVLVCHGTEDQIIAFDRSAIINQKNKITNPNVKYYVIDEPERNTHAGYFDMESGWLDKMNSMADDFLSAVLE